MDFVQARYYSSVQGRFTSVDPYSLILDKQAAGRTSAAESEFTSWISDPRRWNKYAFALNNPLRYVDQDGEDPIEALEKAVQQLARFRDLAGSMIRSGKANIAAEATRLALEAVFGKQIAVTAGGLSGAEVELAKEVSAFEGKSFLGVRNSSQEGIDGILFDGYAPTNTNSFQPVQLQENSTGGELRILNDSTRHANQIDKAGMNNISLFVKSTDKSVTVGSLLTFIKNGGNGGLVGTSNRSAIKNVTIFAQDGVVRIEKGKVYSCDSNNKCQSR